MSESPGLTRAERRQRTQERILDSARDLFAQHGFERTTIRGVASAAGVDPALVMQYYGSKRELFARAAQVPVPLATPAAEEPADIVEALLSTLGSKLDGLPATTLTMMRSMLTHPEAQRIATETFDRQVEEITAVLSGADAQARAALLICVTVGVTIGHQMLGVEALRGLRPHDITELLRPALHALIGP
ncbi:TetR/AcrR family transcriptional regulator [Streptomyces sp. NBC_01803]|uniref:TetR/AcrR family transcriptional regulator n=1 Tax=Streptomyces sp. NBC_01803 TaxID=2975946 RepID=UPI002DD84A11|nr:TetR family transcriptional regulator [Streptomyces sp. NBC_01803]WSA44280.1 TetR/AcrR family transcriptional regulator [Streptomyces sp. NBC_01803]